jgi:contractile injection system tube protein/LysM domain-containing protein
MGKAEIVNLDTNERLECSFNPKDYSFSKSNQWKEQKTSGKNVPQLSFEGGSPATLQMELYFDTYAKASGGSKPKDVRKEYTDKLWKLMMVEPKTVDKKSKKGRPPRVRFLWGRAWSFTAVITQIQQKFTLFSPDGTPVRAICTVSFQQEKDEASLAPQNPTSGGESGHQFWTVSEGDTLGWIAYQSYGLTSRWREIADANNLSSVRDLVPGMVLVIPNA